MAESYSKNSFLENEFKLRSFVISHVAQAILYFCSLKKKNVF